MSPIAESGGGGTPPLQQRIFAFPAAGNVDIIGLMDTEQFSRIARALADPRRMEILRRIASEREVACAALAGGCEVSQPTISHHLKELSNAGLVKPRREAKFCFYRLDRKVWAEYLAEMRRQVPIRPHKK